MKKIKSFWAFVLAICLIVPAMLMFTACSNDTVSELSGTNIVAEGKFEKGTTLSSAKIEESDASYSSAITKIASKKYDTEKVAVFNISLANSKGSKIQPNGKVKISMPKPFESELGFVTFHIKEDETVEELETTLNGTNIVFETESFSPFIIAGRKNTPAETSVTVSHSLENSAPDSLEHQYNGTAVFVSKKDITFNGTKLNEITDENILNKITYKWRNRNTKEEVTPDVDITINGKAYVYGKDSDKIVGDEFAGPCVVGEYEFVLLYDGNEVLSVDATITENTFKKISSFEELKETDAVAFGDLYYYTIVGIADGKMYVMQMPSIDSDEILSCDAEARLVSPNEDGSIFLGEKYDFAFTSINYFLYDEVYYNNEKIAENLLVDFCTGYYGSRTATIGLAGTVIERTGWTKLSGEKICRVEGIANQFRHGNRVVFGENGAVTIYEPRKDETENNSLRLVRNSDGTFVFTGKDATTDTRESFPIYIYRSGKTITEKFAFHGDLNNNNSFNAYKDVEIQLETGEDVYNLIKMDAVRFVFSDLEGNIKEYGAMDSEGNVNAPTLAGKYQLVVQIKVKCEDGEEWKSKAVLQEFEVK